MPKPNWDWIELGFACYRLSRLLTDKSEMGPGDILHKIRMQMGVFEYGEDGKPNSFTGKLFDCPYCLGIWCGAAIILLPDSSLKRWLVRVFAVVGLQTLLQDYSRQ